MNKLKLIWDFRGPDAHKIAEHHEIHLKEYIDINKITAAFTGCNSVNSNHSIAFMVVNETDMKSVRDALRPHRGQLYND